MWANGSRICLTVLAYNGIGPRSALIRAFCWPFKASPLDFSTLDGPIRANRFADLRKSPDSCESFLNKFKTTPTPNKNGSYGIKGGARAIFSVENPLILTDFYAIRTPIVWHIWGAYFLQIWGVGVGRIIFIFRVPELNPFFCESRFGEANIAKMPV